jgi:hypothetical protein
MKVLGEYLEEPLGILTANISRAEDLKRGCKIRVDRPVSPHLATIVVGVCPHFKQVLNTQRRLGISEPLFFCGWTLEDENSIGPLAGRMGTCYKPTTVCQRLAELLRHIATIAKSGKNGQLRLVTMPPKPGCLLEMPLYPDGGVAYTEFLVDTLDRSPKDAIYLVAEMYRRLRRTSELCNGTKG